MGVTLSIAAIAHLLRTCLRFAFNRNPSVFAWFRRALASVALSRSEAGAYLNHRDLDHDQDLLRVPGEEGRHLVDRIGPGLGVAAGGRPSADLRIRVDARRHVTYRQDAVEGVVGPRVHL